jgi:hypothetical protein
MLATEDVERQVAIGVTIAMEEAPFLQAMQRVVGSAQVQDDLLGWLAMRFKKQIN